MLSELRPAIVVFVALTLVTGIAYPLAITGVGQVVFPRQANGSIITVQGQARGSLLIGQEFGTSDAATAGDHAKWFWGRPSATSPVAYSPLNLSAGAGSSGSNLAPTNPTLVENVQRRLAALRVADAAVGVASIPAVPIDLVTASGSGLDPHISPDAAVFQVARVAKARGLTEASVRELVVKHTTSRTFGVLGEPAVNVLELNLELDTLKP